MKPLFEVGEEVILQSKGSPELNGEYTVYDIARGGDEYTCRITNLLIDIDVWEGFGYRLVEIAPEGKSVEGITVEKLWAESALKKKHKPSDKSFDEMMTKLKYEVRA